MDLNIGVQWRKIRWQGPRRIQPIGRAELRDCDDDAASGVVGRSSEFVPFPSGSTTPTYLLRSLILGSEPKGPLHRAALKHFECHHRTLENPQDAEDSGFNCDHATRECRALHKISWAMIAKCSTFKKPRKSVRIAAFERF